MKSIPPLEISEQPKIHILLATFNRAHMIGETLDSIINQTYTNWECFIVDDFSSDGTPAVIENYIRRDNRFSYFPKTEQHNRGLSASRNYGMELAQERGAEFIQFFDDDDIMHPQKLELQMNPLILNPSLDLTICRYRKFHQSQTIEYDLSRAEDGSCNIETDDLLKGFFLNQIDLNSPGPLWRAEILANYRFNEKLFYAEEREFYLRIFLNERPKYLPIKKVLFWYRKHDKAITSKLYKDSTEIERSSSLFDRLFLDEILRQKKAPNYILKVYGVRALKDQNKNISDRVLDYLASGNRVWNPNYLKVYLYLRLRQVLKKFNA